MVWVAASLCYRIPEEDEMMRREFREVWDSWAARTPYKLIPFVY